MKKHISHSVNWVALALILLAVPVASHAAIGFGVSIRIGPPVLPVYVQPVLPGPGYIWQPGYWAYGPNGYFWVPGTWVLPPETGLLWTPGYWGWNDGLFVWNEGYWGPTVGFYGGVCYGFGYGGVGYLGGEWRGGNFFYNSAVSNVAGVHITNVYNQTVVVNNRSNVSFNGGPGGISARPTAAQLAAAHDPRVRPPTAAQTQHVASARSNHELLASVNHGKPAIAASPRPGVFSGRGVVAARSAGPGYKPEVERAANPAPRTSAPAARQSVASKPSPTRPSLAAQHRAVPAHPGEATPARSPAVAARPQVQPKITPSRPESQPRPAATAPRPMSEPRPQAQPKPMTTPRPESHPKPATAPRPMSQPKPQAQPKPMASPRPESQPRPAASAPRPESRPESRPKAEAESKP